MAAHDQSYKLLFSHPEMVRDLFQGFVHEPWVAELDFSTLERVSESFVSEDLTEREADMIWRVRWKQQWLYLYLLIEFQSTVDKFMAVRCMTYIGLLYQSIIKNKQLTPQHLLPPVFPLVLYNGRERWNAATRVSVLIEPVLPELARYLPELQYELLDE